MSRGIHGSSADYLWGGGGGGGGGHRTQGDRQHSDNITKKFEKS